MPPDAIDIVFPDHVAGAIVCIVLAIIIAFLALQLPPRR
jgi:hypothetical protein